MRACPICLRENAALDPAAPIHMLAFRGDWLLREVTLCCRHKYPLITLWESSKPSDRYDVAAQTREKLGQILTGALDRPFRDPSPYDLWLDHRLETGQDPTWLANHSLFAATTMCSLLGAILIPRSSNAEDRQALEHAAGFSALAKGEASFRAALKQCVEQATGYHIGPRTVFGKLYDALDDYLGEDQFDLFRNALRDRVLASWPIGAGETVLGQVIPKRILHSSTTAAKDIGVTPGLVEKFLIDAGALPEHDYRPPALRTFDAGRFAGVLAEIPTLVGPLEMQAAIGATKAQLRSLREDRILIPRISQSKIDSPWRIADGVALLNELTALSSDIPIDDSGWEDIQGASKRKRLKVGDIIAAVRRREISLGRMPGTFGYRHFIVPKLEIDKLVSHGSKTRFHTRPAVNATSAAAFARSIGMRGDGWFNALFDAGHVSARWMPHPITNVRILYVSDEDIAAFNQRFLTSPQMQIEFGLHRRTCLARLRKAGVSPFAPEGKDFGALFERCLVEPVLRGMHA